MVRVVVMTLLSAACTGITAVPGPSGGGGGGTTSSASALESEIHSLINQRRASRGLPALQWDPRIAEVAREHSEAMAAGRRGFGHDGFDARAATIGREMTVRSMAENVAYDSRDGSQLASQVVQGWISSAGHRQNLEGAFTRAGVGVARRADGTRYFTQIFVNGG